MKTSMTYGTMPTREQFDAGWDACEAGDVFHFGNDPRVGNRSLTQEELWRELVQAHAEWESTDLDDPGSIRETKYDAGEWCSAVLSVLGIEWI